MVTDHPPVGPLHGAMSEVKKAQVARSAVGFKHINDLSKRLNTFSAQSPTVQFRTL